MLSQQEDDVNSVDRELSSQENPAGEQSDETERRYISDLLDLSEKNFTTDLQPYESNMSNSGWEEAVCGWVRAAPSNCIPTTQRNHEGPKHKEVHSPTPLCVDPTPSNADSSAGIAKHHRKSHVGPSNGKKYASMDKPIGSWGPSEWPVLNATHRDTTQFLLDGKTEERSFRWAVMEPPHLFSQYSDPDNRYAKPQKHSHRIKNTVVPIKTLIFLPPIQPPQRNPKVSCHVCRSKPALDRQTHDENLFMLDKRSEGRRTGVDLVN